MKTIDYKNIDKLEFLNERFDVNKFGVNHHVEYKCKEDFNVDEFIQLIVDIGFKVKRSSRYYNIDNLHFTKKTNSNMYVILVLVNSCTNIKNSIYLGTNISFSPAKYTNLIDSLSYGYIIQHKSFVENTLNRKLYTHSTTNNNSLVPKFDKMIFDKLQNMIADDFGSYIIISHREYNQQSVMQFYDVNMHVIGSKKRGINIMLNKSI